MRRLPLVLMSALVLANASLCSAQILHKKKKTNKSTDATNTAEPDKQLYDKAMDDIKHGRHEVGRLGLQTLINTYPDSEYLAKAKLAIADSYYKEGGSANTTQAIAGYKDFIVFFPFLPEAAYAQMQVAMANYNEMPKPDRDNTHTKMAEEEFQIFLQKYPKDPLAPKAEQRLREVQEVLAEAQFRIGYYYFIKGDPRAAAGRLAPLVQRYPLYSKTDDALWMLGDIFERAEKKQFAGWYYSRIIRNYPLSSHAPQAKDKLKAMGFPIPQPDPRSLAWMTAEQNAPRPKENVPHRAFGILHSAPDVHMTAQNGRPQMEPESENPETETLSGGNRTTLVGNQTGGGSTGASPAVVETVRPGDPAPAKSADTDDTTTSSSSDNSSDNNTTSNTTSTANSISSDLGDATASAQSGGNNASGTDNSGQNAGSNTKGSQKESSSKKKGLKKIVPW